ncbi:MAG: phosphopantetheine-binding protein, partial [Cetobacterium sp.]
DLKKLKELGQKDFKDNIDEVSLSSFEKKIIKIWEEILEIKIDKNKVNWNFYELGADSLSIVRFINEIEPFINKEGVEKILLNPNLETISKYKK